MTSFIHFEVDRCGDAAKLDALRDEIAKVLRDVRAAVEDWPKIVELARVTIKGMKAGEGGPEGLEARAFLEWMVADHFTFLGQRDYELVQHDIGYGLRAVPGSGLGILRDALRPTGAAEITPLPPAAPRSFPVRRRSF